MMNGSRGSYSMTGGAPRPTNSAPHFASAVVSHDKLSSAANGVSVSSHATRSPVTSSYHVVAPSNGVSSKQSNGHSGSSASENGNGIMRHRTASSGRVSSSSRVPAEQLEVIGSAGTRSSSIETSQTFERRSQLSNGDVIRSSSSSVAPKPPHSNRLNGNGNHVINSATTRVCVQNGDHCQAEKGSSPLNGKNHLETTDIDSLALDLVDHPFFALTDDSSQQDSFQIVSERGTVRGVRNRVKAGIAVFVEQQGSRKQKDYRSLESGKIVVYTTSVMVVRDTYDKCLRVNKILQTHVVRYEQRDVSLSRDDHRELVERLGPNVDLPQVFADGIHIGDADEIVRLNENGTLRKIFHRFKTVPSLASCAKCGGYRYVPCANCHGSKKSRRNNFTKEFCALRCTICDDNGLVLCDICSNDELSSCF